MHCFVCFRNVAFLPQCENSIGQRMTRCELLFRQLMMSPLLARRGSLGQSSHQPCARSSYSDQIVANRWVVNALNGSLLQRDIDTNIARAHQLHIYIYNNNSMCAKRLLLTPDGHSIGQPNRSRVGAAKSGAPPRLNEPDSIHG